MSNEIHILPPPPRPAEIRSSTPKKAWSKPTISIIGETDEAVGSGPQFDINNENQFYTNTS